MENKNAPPPPQHKILICLFIFLSLFFTRMVYAQNAEETCSFNILNAVVPPFSIGQDAALEMLMQPVSQWSSIGHFEYSCLRTVIPNQSVSLDFFGLVSPVTNRVAYVVLDGVTYGVYPVYPDSHSLKGLGIVISYRTVDNSIIFNRFPINWTPVTVDAPQYDSNINFTISGATSNVERKFIVFEYRVRFILIDWFSERKFFSGGISNIFFHVRRQYMLNGVIYPHNHISGHLNQSARVESTRGSCTTPPADQLVKLPMVYANEFVGVADTRGEINFDLTFSNCNRYMHAIRYKFYSTHSPDNTDAVNAAEGLVSLNSQPGSASGIKVQILDRDTNQPITLDQFRIAPQYTGTQTGFTIPFKARYYQSESTVTAGKVRATAFFQIIYQ